MVRSNPLSVHSSLPPPPSSNPIPLRRCPNPNFRPKFSDPLLLTGYRRSSFRCPLVGGGGSSGSSWDSNAESVRAGRFKFRDGGAGGDEGEGVSWRSDKRRWWSDDSDEPDEDFEAFDDDPVEQDPWDKIWIFKVFKSYGYLLPAIIVSMLLATGPKAFLMALALPLGQSAISLAIDKVWGKVPGGQQTRRKSKKKSFTRSDGGYKRQWQDRSSYNSPGRHDYQSWVSMDPGVDDKAKTSEPSLGGWDDLDRQGGSTSGRARQQPSTPRSSPESELVKKGKLSKRGRYKGAPLFLRLLIAVFPFLGSWTRMLW
ncbi:uncharacterized protein LOC135595402 [Musa acuminata AAA Group]|uniref:uncharacterized protein LOC135595402 n=1 Tax=Musa acuminata AAA Group TaxID=214697 RepID=UPI0031E04342